MTKVSRRKENGPQKRGNGNSSAAAKLPVQLPRNGGRLLATAYNDITIPHFGEVLEAQDPTIRARGASKGTRLYDETLKDGRANSTFKKRVSKVTRRPWVVEPASEDALDVKAADGIRDILSGIPFDQICKDQLQAIFYGYSVGEIVWGRNRDGLIVPLIIKDHERSRFRFDRDWQLRLVTQESGIEGIELPKRKFLVHRYGAQGNNPYGLGLGSVVFWHVLFKRDGVASWLTHLEKFASPIPFGRFPSGTSPAEQERLLVYLKMLVQNGALVAPIGTEMEFLEAKRAGEAGYENWCRYWDEQTAEVILGSTLTTSVKGEGSRAASQTHADETEALVDDDADELSETLNSTLIQWICELNWPDATPPTVWRPRPRNVKEEEEQKKLEHDRQQSAIRTLMVLRSQGFEPKDVQNWLGGVMETEMVPVKASKAPNGPDPETASFRAATAPVDFAQDAGPVDYLIDQLAELASDPTEAWLGEIRQKLSGATSFAEASKALLEIFPELDIDPMGNVLGDALALSELIGRSDVFDETGIYPAQPKGSKKKT